MSNPEMILKNSGNRRLRICLTASGGGHLRQLIDLASVIEQHDHFFVSEDTPLARQIAAEHHVRFVDHWAFGQLKLGRPFHMILAGAKNLWESARIVINERPDIIISLGAGSTYFVGLFAWVLGAEIVLIESYARFTTHSLFWRLTKPLSRYKIAQSARFSGEKGIEVYDPFKFLDVQRPLKKNLLFATVGVTLSFDRMIEMIETLADRKEISEEIIIQSGNSHGKQSELQSHEFLSTSQTLELMRDADIVVTHAGTGSIITALRQGCRVIVVPRQYSKSEHYDDHQSEIASAFAERNLVKVVNNLEEMSAALRDVREQTPLLATTDPSALISRLSEILQEVEKERLLSLEHKSPRRSLFGITFANSTAEDIAEQVCSPIQPTFSDARILVTTNVDHVVRLHRDPTFYAAYRKSWMAVVDGFPVLVMAKLRGLKIKGRVAGSDLFPEIMSRLSPNLHRPFFLASKAHSAEYIVAWLLDRGFSRDQIAVEVPPFGFETDTIYCAELTASIRKLQTTHLFMGVGCPKSELWAEENKLNLGNLYVFCFGAALEFFSHTTPRAPIILRKIGLEWTYRLIKNPKRLWKRYLINSWRFLYAVFDDFRFDGKHRHSDESRRD